MKKALLTAALLLLTALSAFALGEDIPIDQDHFPDGIFRDYVAAQFDGDGSGSLSEAEIENATQIQISDEDLTNLQGVGYFKFLRSLKVPGAQLETLDVSPCSRLTELDCSGNRLLSLDLSGNTALVSFNASSQKPLVPYIVRADGFISASVGKGLEGSVFYGDCEYDTTTGVLTCFCEFDDIAFATYTKNGELRVAGTLLKGEECLPVDAENFPDDVFRAYVAEKIDTNGDGMLTRAEREACREIKLSKTGLTSLEGVGYFPNLTELYCDMNALTALDLRGNAALQKLFCNNNNLSSLDVSACTQLKTIRCGTNALTKLDVGKNGALEILICTFNSLTELDVSANTELYSLSCSNNQLTALDTRKNTKLIILSCNSNLLTELDLSANANLSNLTCSSNRLTRLDLSANTELTADELSCFGQSPVLPFCHGDGKLWCMLGKGLTGAKFGDNVTAYEPETGRVYLKYDMSTFNYSIPVGCDNVEMTVRVNAAPEIRVEKIVPEKEVVELRAGMGKGESYTPAATVLPETATWQDIEWDTEDGKIARCIGGVVHPISAGETVLYAMAKDGGGVKGRCIVRVSHDHTPEFVPPVPASGDADGSIRATRCRECGELLTSGSAISHNAVLDLPDDLTRVDPDAFAGAAAQQANIPKGIVKIEKGTFTGSACDLIVFENGDTEIGEDAFDAGVWFMSPGGGKVEAYAGKYGFRWFELK